MRIRDRSSLLTNRMLASRLTGVAALHAAALQGALDDSLAISESIPVSYTHLPCRPP